MTDTIERLQEALAGRYRIERELGEGGMAIVYLATDLKHKRKVALKVLRPELAALVGAERFLAEIEVTAGLQHPHILPLFDSGEADGFLFYVMPYVEGESLREELEREQQLAVDDALDITRKVADALAYAHGKGVVHRDIKPANILLSEGGEPLVADFGIALAVSQAGSGRLTETGLSLGTPHYMSPEQATGDRDVDPRSDVYALGCVLYEMLAGQPPFAAPTAQAVLARILTEEPRRITEVRRTVPTHVAAALERALEKLPADRFEAVGDFARALSDPSFRYGRTADVDSAVRHSTRPWQAATATFAVLAGVFGVWAWSGGGGGPAGVTRQRVVLFDWAVLDSADAVSGSVRHGVAIEPDGSSLVLRDWANDRLTLKEEGSLDPLPLAGTEGGFSPAFSPDGDWIAFLVGDAVKKVPRRGGSPVSLAEGIALREQQVAWLDDGRIVFTGLGWHLDAVHQDGGETERLIDVTGSGRFVTGVTALPGSPGVLLSSCDESCPNPEVRVLDFDTGEQRTLVPGATGAWYLNSGHLLFVRKEGPVFVAPFDLDRLEITGPEVPILESVAQTPRRADLAATWEGTVVYLPGSGAPAEGGVVPVWVDLDGNEEVVEDGWSGPIRNPVLSDDDLYVAFTDAPGGASQIRVKELPEGPVAPLTTDDLVHDRPVWIPGSHRLAYVVRRDSSDWAEVRRADASAPAETFLDPDGNLQDLRFSADGRWMIYRLGAIGTNDADLWVADLEGDSVGRRLLATGPNEFTPALSPDNRWLAYTSDESGPLQTVVRPFPDVQAAQHRISVDGGATPLWAPDGSALYFREPNSGWMMEARVQTDPTFRVLERRRLFSMVGYRADSGHWAYDLSSDGTRFFMLRQAVEAPTSAARSGRSRSHVLVQNLVAEIEARGGGRP